MIGSRLPFLLLYAAASAVSVWLLVVTLHRREKPALRYAAVYMACISVWTGGAFLNMLVPQREIKRLIVSVEFVGIAGVAPALVLFALTYFGYERYTRRPTKVVMAGFTTTAIALAWTNPLHGLLFEGSSVHEPSEMLVMETGPMFAVYFGLAFLMVAVVVVFLFVRAFLTSRGVYRRQIAWLLIAIIPPWVAATAFNLEFVRFDVAPLGYLLSGIAITWGITRTDLMDILPIARQLVVETVDAGILVVDGEGRVVDSNPQAVTLLRLDSAPAVGDPVVDCFAGYPEAREQVREALAGPSTQSEFQTSVGDRVVAASVTPVRDARGDHAGAVVLLTDITSERHRQRELQRQNEQLEEFASLVSHDLRNPLTVAEGRIQLARETGDVSELQGAEEAIGRMDDIIDDVLTLASEGRAVEEVDQVSLAEVARDAWSHVDTGEATMSVEDTVVVADESRLLRVFENLFRNAVEHGPADVHLTVDTIEDGFVVADDGPGIPDEIRDQVFESGYTGQDGGTGFGLAIVRSIAEAHGWSVAVTNGERGGARFEFSGTETEISEADAR